MPLTYPTLENLSAQITAEFRVQLPTIDPTIFGSWAMSLANGNAVLAQAILFIVRDLEKQMFPQTATDEFLDLWGGYEDLERLAASPAAGLMSLDDTTSAVGTVIPALTEFTGSNGIIYETTAVSTVIDISQSVTSLTRSGSTVTAILPANHQLATGIEVTISGASAGYNGTYPVIPLSLNSFSYEITGTPASPATGTILYATTLASISVEAKDTGTVTNLDSGAQLSNDTYGTAIAQISGITGGAAEEEDEPYRARILLSRSIIEGVFTPDQIKLAGLSIAGNTRVFVKKPTLAGAGGAVDPEPGEVSVWVLRDNDDPITPSPTTLNLTKDAIIEDGALPANTVAGVLYTDGQVYVSAPTLVATDFDFDALSPDTPTMREAIADQLQAFFDDTVEFEADVTEASYLGAIQNTQDLETGSFVTSFNLTTPSGDISISAGEIATLGVVTFSI